MNTRNEIKQSGTSLQRTHWDQLTCTLWRGYLLFRGGKCISTLGESIFGASEVSFVGRYRIAEIFYGLHDIREIIIRQILLAGQRLFDSCFPIFLIHMIPSNTAMKNVNKFVLGHSRR